MTATEKYEEVIQELGAIIATKNFEISRQKYEIEQLKEELERIKNK